MVYITWQVLPIIWDQRPCRKGHIDSQEGVEKESCENIPLSFGYDSVFISSHSTMYDFCVTFGVVAEETTKM